MIEGWWKLIVADPRNLPGQAPELYKLRDDPGEKHDLAVGEVAKAKKLARQLDAWWPPR